MLTDVIFILLGLQGVGKPSAQHASRRHSPVGTTESACDDSRRLRTRPFSFDPARHHDGLRLRHALRSGLSVR